MKKNEISNSDYELINKWRLTGRIAYIYPRKGIISLNGTNYEYTDAISLIKEFLNELNEQTERTNRTNNN